MVLEKSAEQKKRKLTPKQQKFVDNILSGKNPSEAYKGAYNAKNFKENTLKCEAWKTMQLPHISQTIEERRKQQQQEINYTVRDNFNELDIGAKAAISEGNFSAYVKAIELKGKLLGFYTEKKDIDIKGQQTIFVDKKLDD